MQDLTVDLTYTGNELKPYHVEYSDGRHSLNEIFTVTTSSGATKQLPFKIAVLVADKAGRYGGREDRGEA